MIISEMPLLIVLIFLAQTAGNDSVREYVWYFALEQLFSTSCNVLKGGIDHSLELVSRNNDNRSFPSSKQRQPWCKEALWRHHVWIQQAGKVLWAGFVNDWYKIWWGTSYTYMLFFSSSYSLLKRKTLFSQWETFFHWKFVAATRIPSWYWKLGGQFKNHPGHE